MSMSGEEFENHWRLLAWAMDTLLNLRPGEYPPISYEQTYSAVYKCVCHGYAEELYRKLLDELERQLRQFCRRLETTSDGQLVEAFNTAWFHFSSGISGIVPIFNYLARFYVEGKLNLNLRNELMKIFDNQVLQPIIERLVGQLHYAQHAPFAVQPATMETVARALYKLRPDTVNILQDLYRRFIPELVQQVHVDELPDLQEEARRMMVDARRSFEDGMVENAAGHRSRPLAVATGVYPPNVPSTVDASMDFQFLDDDMNGGGSVSDPISDPVVAKRLKRTRSQSDDSGDDGLVDDNGMLHVDPEEPSPSPRPIAKVRPPKNNNDSAGCHSRKHFHADKDPE